MRAGRVVAQAKINLFLRVLAQERSGYHGLETLFARLELGDDVTVRVGGPERSLDCRGADLGPAERNLAYRAALAYAGAVRWPSGFAIEVDKRIPVGGGLGGGSADAGAVLRILDRLAPAPLPQARLLEIALALGADVPFLATEDPFALAWGRGERLLALPPLPRRPVALCVSDVAVSTADAFRWLAEDRGAYAPRPRLLAWRQLASWGQVAELAENDFEPVVARHVPQLASALGAEPGPLRLPDGSSRIVRMSGSGSTVFVLTVDEPTGPRQAVRTGAGVRLVQTATAERVVEVEVIE